LTKDCNCRIACVFTLTVLRNKTSLVSVQCGVGITNPGNNQVLETSTSGDALPRVYPDERIEQSMGTIRRVTIDNGQIVVIHNNGRIERVPMTNVLRMAVEP